MTIARLRAADVTFVRVRGSHVDHYARKYPDFTSPRTLCGEPATPTWCYVHKTSKRGTVVTEWTEERRPCRRCAVRLEKERVERLRAEAERADEEATKLANSDLATTEQVVRALRAENERLRAENAKEKP